MVDIVREELEKRPIPYPKVPLPVEIHNSILEGYEKEHMVESALAYIREMLNRLKGRTHQEFAEIPLYYPSPHSNNVEEKFLDVFRNHIRKKLETLYKFIIDMREKAERQEEAARVQGVRVMDHPVVPGHLRPYIIHDEHYKMLEEIERLVNELIPLDPRWWVNALPDDYLKALYEHGKK